MYHEEDRLGSDCWESATKHMSWDRIYNSYRSYPVSSVLHHTQRGRMGPGFEGTGESSVVINDQVHEGITADWEYCVQAPKGLLIISM